jgi:N-acetyl-1-D-myo-inositol-2-amino-2-deoxy-alpha-D-glucopyranoside deacetylase
MVVAPGLRATAPAALHPRAFAAPAALAEQAGQLAAILDDVRPQVVVGYDPTGGYGHPDHVRAHQITMAAGRECPSVRKLYWALASREAVAAGLARLAGADRHPPWREPEPDELRGAPQEEITTRIDVRAQLPAKLAALRAHATQLTVWTEGPQPAFALTNEVTQPVLGEECYRLVLGGEPGRDPADEADLFDGIPW